MQPTALIIAGLVGACTSHGVTGIIPPVHAHAHAHTHTHTHTHTQAWLDGVTALQPAFLQPPVWVHDSSGGGGGGGGSEHKRAARANSACVDYTVESYFSGKTKIAGIPSGSYVARPAAISPCELEQLHTDCINRINMYRSGALKFTDGTSDPDVVSGRSPLLEATGANQCSSEASLGDLKINVEGGAVKCTDVIQADEVMLNDGEQAFSCASNAAQAQNSCCARGGGSWGDNRQYVTYEATRGQLFSCLQQMWDEGITPGQKGHWISMKNPSMVYAMCGFAWNTNGRLFMNQDFVSRNPAGSCSCAGKSAGASDGCGGVCVSGTGGGSSGTDGTDGTGGATPTPPPASTPPTEQTSSGTGTGDTGACKDDASTNLRSSSCGGRCDCPSAVSLLNRMAKHPCSASSGLWSVLEQCPKSCSTCTDTAPSLTPTPSPAGSQTTLTQPAAPTPPPGSALPGCTAPKDGSRGNCETCFHKNQCDTANNYYCCPYMRKCIQSGGSCTSPTARCNPRCSDSTCDLEQGCASCTGCQYVGAGQQYSWLEWANLGDSGGSMSKYSPTCSSSGSAAATTHTPATTKELAAITVTHTTATSSSTSASTATVTPCKDGALFEFDNFEIGLLGENTLKYINSVSDMGGPITELGCAKRCIHWEGTQKAVDGSYTAVECVAFNWQTEEKACILKSSRGGALNAEGYREKFRFYNKLIGTSCRRSTSTTTSTQITTTTTTPDTTAITATSSTITTTTLMVDCEFSFSTCSPSCEKGVDRVISISRHATGAGAPCPVQNDFPDCHPGDGLCPTSTTTLSTTTTATSTTATLATTATVKTKVTTTEHTSEGGGPIAVVKCPGGVLEGYGPARNNKKGRFLKGSGIIRYVHISATLDTCAQECYVDAVCRGFSIRTEGDAVCQLHNTAGVTGMLQSDQAGWLFYLKGSGCTSHMSTADPATTLAPGSSVISSSQTVGQSGTSIAVTKVVTPATLPSTISQTGSTDAVTGVPVGSATIAEEASTLIFVSRAPLISTTVAEAEVRSQNDAASNEFNPTLVSCWLALDCATLDIAVVINDVYLGLAGCGVPRTLIKTITVKCGSTQILISTTSAQAANGVRARIKAQELVIRTHGQDLNATLDTSTPPFAADGNKVGVLPTALEDENPKTTPGVSNKTNATTVESTAADNMESSDAKDNAAPVVAGVLAAVCVAALLAIGVMVIIRRNNDTPTQNKPVINSTAHTSSARLVDRTEPSSITGGGVVLDSNNKRVLVLEEDDQFQTTIRTMSDGASSSEYTPVDSNEAFTRLESLRRDNPLYKHENQQRQRNRQQTVDRLTSDEEETAALRRSSHFFQSADNEAGVMMRKNSQSYSDSVGVQETTFNIGQETTFNIGQDYAEIPARTSQEPQYESIEQQQTDSSNAEPVTYDSNNMKVPVTLNAGQSQIDI